MHWACQGKWSQFIRRCIFSLSGDMKSVYQEVCIQLVRGHEVSLSGGVWSETWPSFVTLVWCIFDRIKWNPLPVCTVRVLSSMSISFVWVWTLSYHLQSLGFDSWSSHLNFSNSKFQSDWHLEHYPQAVWEGILSPCGKHRFPLGLPSFLLS